MIGFTKSLALSYSATGITANAICPGWVDTEMYQNRLKEIGQSKEENTKTIPQRKIINPSEIANLAFYLGSTAASSITGQTITIDAGLTI